MKRTTLCGLFLFMLILFPFNMKAHVYLGELLIQMGGDKNKTEARSYLEKATQSDDPYFRDNAMELLAKLT